MKYQRILRAVSRMPWCIVPEKLAEIVSVLQDRALELERLESDSINLEPKQSKRETVGDVAVIPVHGTIAPRMNMMSALSGGTTADVLRAQVMSAANDDSIKSILLDIDSPGGSAYGIPEVGMAVYDARQKKPVVALANPVAFSAAYWIASQASEIVSVPSGEVGSIGVVYVHQDYSKWFEDQGVKNTIIQSGEFKAEGNPFEPLSEDAKAEFQRISDLIHQDFIRAVAKGRMLPPSTIRSSFGDGRTFLGAEAKDRRMIDRVETSDDLMVRLSKPASRSRIGRKAQISERELEDGLREMLGMSNRMARSIASASKEILDGDVRDELTESDNSVRDERETEAPDVRDERGETEVFDQYRKILDWLKN